MKTHDGFRRSRWVNVKISSGRLQDSSLCNWLGFYYFQEEYPSPSKYNIIILSEFDRDNLPCPRIIQ